MRIYLNDFASAVDGEPSNKKATGRMKRLYPDCAQADFPLLHNVAFYGPDTRYRDTA